jgi:hypothetical protein
MQPPGITLNCPPEAPGTEPISVQVQTNADMRTYYDNDGIIDKALTVALIRRDRPGLRFLAKIDPRAIMLPDTPLDGRPSDEELDSDLATVSEDKVLDARPWEEARQGAGEYFVTAAFSKWWAGVRNLRVTDGRNRVAPWEAPRRERDGRAWTARPRSTEGEIPIHLEHAGGQDFLAVPIPASLFAAPQWAPVGAEQPWLSVVGFNLCTRGGACGGDFAVDVGRRALPGDVLIPLSALAPTRLVGDWLFLAVAGGQLLAPAEVQLGATDAR